MSGFELLADIFISANGVDFVPRADSLLAFHSFSTEQICGNQYQQKNLCVLTIE